jgi:hypothetical protein
MITDKNISLVKTIWSVVAFIVFLTVGAVEYMGQFATKNDVRLSQLATELRIVNIIITRLDYKIASGQSLSPIDQNTYNKYNREIEAIQTERKAIISEQ